jgi:hypothetical protein
MDPIIPEITTNWSYLHQTYKKNQSITIFEVKHIEVWQTTIVFDAIKQYCSFASKPIHTPK